MRQSIRSQISETNPAWSQGVRRSQNVSRTALSGPAPRAIIDKFAILPITTFFFALVVFPLLISFSPGDIHAAEGRPETRIFWPAMAAISTFLAVQTRSRLTLPPHIICLLAYLAFAGASVLWAFSPEYSFIRYLQQLMIVAAIVPPIMLASRTLDILRGVYLCFLFALLLNMLFVWQGSATMASNGQGLVNIGYQGYFLQKNALGECAAAAYLLALRELFQRGWGRRALAAMVVVIAVLLVFLSQSKTSFGLALVCPMIAWLTLLLRKATRASPAIILSAIPLCFLVLSMVSKSDLMGRISYLLFHDSTLTGRTIIWDFAKGEVANRPLLGWGYQSFWLVPDSPSAGAPGWVKMMPNAHNGYYDTMLETGYVGLALLLVFVVATLHAVGRVADRDPARARFLLSFALFFILYNFFESMWMRGYLFLWVMFVIVVAEIGRYWRPLALGRALVKPRRQDPGSPGPPSARMLRIEVS